MQSLGRTQCSTGGPESSFLVIAINSQLRVEKDITVGCLLRSGAEHQGAENYSYHGHGS
jgi:hypothetical protein